jgi:hypothetical protein
VYALEQGTHRMARAKFGRLVGGGASRDRTDDLLVANQALSQLSYGPNEVAGPGDGGTSWTRTNDLTLIKRLLYQLSYGPDIYRRPNGDRPRASGRLGHQPIFDR